MSLLEQIMADLKTAMKTKDKQQLNVIRMLKSAIQMAKIELKHDLSDEEIIDVVQKQIKLRKDSVLEFEKAGREDLAAQNKEEILILKKYMPEELSLDEVNKIIDEAFLKINPQSPKQMGLVMKEVSPRLKGRFDMGEVSKIIKEKLNS